MKSKKRNKLNILTIMFIFAITLIVGFESMALESQSQEAITIKIATATGPSHIISRVAQKLEEDLEAMSNGRIQVDLYLAGALLDDGEMPEGVKQGITDIASGSLALFSNNIPETRAIGLMGTFDSEEHFWRACQMEGGFHDYLKDLFLEKQNIRILSFQHIGITDAFGSNRGVIKTLEDLKGLKVRVPNVAIGTAIQSMGASPVVLSGGDTYSALQNGVVEGTYTSTSTVISRSFYEVTDYYTDMKLGYSDAIGVWLSENTFNKWPDDVKAMVMEACKDILTWTRNLAKETVIEDWNFLKNECQVYHLTDEETEPFRILVAPGQLEGLKEACSEESNNKLLDIMEKARE